MATQAIAEEVAAHNSRQAADDSTNAAGGNTLRFTIRDEGDLTRACETALERLQGENMSTQTFQQRHDTDAGRMVLQRVHDEVARAGAVCVAPKNLSASAEFISKHESGKIQAIHDLCLEGGAKCAERGSSPYFSGEQPTLRDPKERARAHVEKRNKLIKGEGTATTQAELSEPTPSSDPQEAARERARAVARRHVEKRNRQIEQRKADIKEGRDPYHWRQR
jgi:hypothetical protein